MIRAPFAVVLAALFVLVNAVIGLPAAGAQPLPRSEPVLRLDVTSFSPRIVTHSSRTLTISAQVTNISGRPVHNLEARLQAGAAQTTAAELGQALRATAATDSHATPFRPVAPVLQPGQRAQLTIVADLRGGPGGLPLAEPGVYPLLINVNGRPEAEGPARLAAMNVLLPVRSAPGDKSPPKRPDTRQKLTVLWPIASKPRVVSDPVGGRLLLSDDTIAKEMRPGGRLDALVSTAEQARTDPDVFGSLCFAVDPELVSTAEGMSQGYRVRDDEAGSVRGSGRLDAKAWLKALRTLVKDQCVLPTPYAGADLPALAAGLPELATAAADRDDVIEDVLGVQPLSGAIWPTGPLSDNAVQALHEAGKDTLLSSTGELDTPGLDARPRALATGDGGAEEQRVLPYDELLALALTPGSASQQVGHNATVAADDTSIATQNAVATVLFNAAGAAAAEDADDRPLLVAPPRVWKGSAAELGWLLQTLGELDSAGVIAPTELSELLEASNGEPVRPTVGGTVTGRLPSDVAAGARAIEATLADLGEAMTVDPSEQVEPSEVLAPMRNGLLRAASTWWRQRPVGRQRALSDAESQLDTLLDSVTVTDPRRTIGLASGSSPIPVSIANRLPVEVTVQVLMSNTTGLRPSEVPAVTVPAGRSRNVKVPAEALRAGRFTVDVAVTTPGGTNLGEPTRIELASTEYGAITVIVTATAAGALLLLSGRRIYRRLRPPGANRG